MRTDGEYSTVNDVKNALISLPTGGTVRLSQLADISMQPKDQDAITKVDGEACILLSVNKQSGSNTVQIANRVNEQLESVLADQQSLDWSIVMDQSEYINMTVDNAIQNIIMGVLFAAIVLFLFLRDLGATMAVSIAMPCCILFTFLIMRVCNITLNMMSLGGITLGVGMIVDNSIVVLENIFTYRADGYDRLEACTRAPARSSRGHRIHADHGRRIPADRALRRHDRHDVQGILHHDRRAAAQLAHYFADASCRCCATSCSAAPGRRKDQPIGSGKTPIIDKPLSHTYRGALGFLITHRWAGLAITAGICVLSVISIGLAGMELVPDMDQGEVDVSVSMPNGSTMEDTAAIQDRIVDIAANTIPEMEQVYYSTGSSTSIMSSASGASVTIKLVDLKDRDRSSDAIAKQLRRDLADIAGCEITVSTGSTMSMSTDSDISIELSGNDYDQLADTADQLVERSRSCRTPSMSSPRRASRRRASPLRSTARTHPASA